MQHNMYSVFGVPLFVPCCTVLMRAQQLFAGLSAIAACLAVLARKSCLGIAAPCLLSCAL
jgi:hypothetical protein